MARQEDGQDCNWNSISGLLEKQKQTILLENNKRFGEIKSSDNLLETGKQGLSLIDLSSKFNLSLSLDCLLSDVESNCQKQ